MALELADRSVARLPSASIRAGMASDDSRSRRDERRLARRLRRRDRDALGDVYARFGAATFGLLLRCWAIGRRPRTSSSRYSSRPGSAPSATTRTRGGLRTWLLTIARSRAIDHLRRRVPEPRDPTRAVAVLGRPRETRRRRRRPARALVPRTAARAAARRRGRRAAAPLLRRTQPDGDRRGDRRPAGDGQVADGQRARAPARVLDGSGDDPARRRRLPARRARRRAARPSSSARWPPTPRCATEVERLRPVVTRLEALPGERLGTRRRRHRSPCRSAPGAAHARLGLRPLVAAACAVVLLAGGIGLGALLDARPRPSRRRSRCSRIGCEPRPRRPEASGTVEIAAPGGATVRVSGLRPDDGRRVLRAVAARRGQASSSALGSFRVGADGAATLEAPAAGRSRRASSTSTSRSSRATAIPATPAPRCCAAPRPPRAARSRLRPRAAPCVRCRRTARARRRTARRPMGR